MANSRAWADGDAHPGGELLALYAAPLSVHNWDYGLMQASRVLPALRCDFAAAVLRPRSFGAAAGPQVTPGAWAALCHPPAESSCRRWAGPRCRPAARGTACPMTST